MSRESARGALSTIGLIPGHFFTVFREITAIESYQGALRPIVLSLAVIVYWIQGNNIKIFSPKVITAHWVHPWQFFCI